MCDQKFEFCAFCISLIMTLHAVDAAELIQIHNAEEDHYIVNEPRISPDGKWVVFWEYIEPYEEAQSGPATLYSVRADGSAAPIILDTGTQSFREGEFRYFDARITSDSLYVLYNTNRDGSVSMVSIEGGPPQRLGDGWRDSPLYRNICFSPDERYVISVADGGIASILLPDGPYTVLNHYTDTGPMIYFDYAVSPDSSRVVFRAEGFSYRNDGDVALFCVPIGGGEVTRLSPDMAAGRAVENFQVSPDSQWVVYNSDQEIDDNHRLYSVPITGGPSIKLDDPENTLGKVSPTKKYWISPNSQHVAFQAYLEVSGGYALTNIYSISIEGGVPVQLNEPFPKGINSSQGGFTNDSQYVAFGARGGGAYATPVGGGKMVALHPPLDLNRYVDQICVFPNLSQIFSLIIGGKVFRNSPDGGQYREIASSVAGLTYHRPAYLSPDGRRFVYNGGPSQMSVMQSELGTGEVTPLFDPSQSYSSTTFFAVSELDNRILFENDNDIYARALEDFPSATQPAWTEYE